MCQRCGECCRYFALPFSFRGMPPHVESIMVEWLVKRGFILEKGFLIIPSQCPKLEYDELTGEAVCRLHKEGKKPIVCRNYPLPTDWVPKVCVYAEESQREKEDSKKQKKKGSVKVSSVDSGI